MTRGAFEKIWIVYGGWLQALSDNEACSGARVDPLTKLCTRESMRKVIAFRKLMIVLPSSAINEEDNDSCINGSECRT